jgi:hypothetical protein
LFAFALRLSLLLIVHSHRRVRKAVGESDVHPEWNLVEVALIECTHFSTLVSFALHQEKWHCVDGRLAHRHKVDTDATVHHALLGDLSQLGTHLKVPRAGRNHHDGVTSADEVSVHKVFVQQVQGRVDGF